MVLQFHRYTFEETDETVAGAVVAEKLNHHRLKPGGVLGRCLAAVVAEKLRYHQLKPGGVQSYCLL